MRQLTWFLGLGAIVVVGACSSDDDGDTSSSNTGATGGDSSGSAGGPSAGGSGGQAATCGACADDGCSAEVSACTADAEACADWWTCVESCSDAECRAGCDMQFIAVEAQYLPVYECLCDACGTECAALEPCEVQPCVDEGLPLLMTPPATLAETGLFASEDTQDLAPYVQHFAPQFELWSDGAVKERWVYIPKCSPIDNSDPNHWNFPVGTRLWKQFTRDGTRVETRLIHKFGTGTLDWIFAAYQWNPDQTVANHVPDGVVDASGTPHNIPSENDCKNCHAKLDERILGFGSIQLSYVPAAGDVDIASLSAAGKLTVPAPDGFTVPGAEIAQKAIGYMHANCGNCHNDTGVLQVDMRLRLLVGATTVEQTDVWKTAVGKDTTNFPCGGCERIEPGNPPGSAVIQRMGTRPGMPPLGTEIVHDEGVKTVSEWIASLQACPGIGEVCDGNIPCCNGSCVGSVCTAECKSADADCASNGECCTGICNAQQKCDCSGDFQPCATDADCCLNGVCDLDAGLCFPH